jgi:hypothetical protein
MATPSPNPDAPSALVPTGNARVDRMLIGMLGAPYVEQADLDGTQLSIYFRGDDDYFVSEEFMARLVIGAAFGFFFRCGLETATFWFFRNGEDVKLRVEQAAFNTFFGLNAEQMTRLASDPDRFDSSPVHRVNEQQQWEFYLQFSKDQKKPT